MKTFDVHCLTDRPKPADQGVNRMVRIIEAKPDPSVVKTIICQNCGGKLEYVPNDVRTLWSGKDYSGGPDGAEGFDCPICKKHVIVRRW